VSIGARIALVRPGGDLLFQQNIHRLDLLNPARTQTQLIALIEHMVDRGHVLEVTMVRTGHHDDGHNDPSGNPQGIGSHWFGWAVDFWFNRSKRLGDWMDVGEPGFMTGLRDLRLAPYLDQIGMTSDAHNDATVAAAGPRSFLDSGGSHLHAGARLQAM